MDQEQLRNLEAQCIQEHAPPCTAACPLHVNVRGVYEKVQVLLLENGFDPYQVVE